MPDTKRGREDKGQSKERQRRAEEVERDVADERERREHPTLTFTGPMRATYTVDWETDDPTTIRCYGVQELRHGVVLLDEDGTELAYVSNRNLVAVEPIPEE